MNAIAVTASIVLFAGCCSCESCNKAEPCADAPGSASVSAQADAIALKPGESHVIVLEENATTGFEWAAKVEGDKVTAEVEHLGPVETNPPLCGAPGSAKVTITAKDGFSGEATVTLSYRRPWEGGETAETRKIKVVAR